MTRFFSFALVALLIASCTSSLAPVNNGSGSQSVVGGKYLKENSRLSKQVAKVNTATGFCSGTFIAPNIVLTAAHCFEVDGDYVRVSMGVDSDSPVFETVGEEFIVNKGYTGVSDAGDDFAVIRTRDSLPKDYIITPLATRRYGWDTPALAAGFGQENYSKKGGPDGKLKYVSLKTKMHWWIFRSFSVSISTEGGISFGDSGGPLFVLDQGALIQAGVASYISPNGWTGEIHKATYASVFANQEWIDAAVAQLLKK